MFSFRTGAVKASRPKGFTLIELLVVIAIIALLAAILFPVFARARENARKSSCSNNVKQIMLGVAQYTQDYDETYPAGWGGPGNVTWHRRVFPYVKSTQGFLCPSQSNPTYTFGGATAGYVNPFVTSYGANRRIIAPNGVGDTALNMADLAKASSTIFLSDSGTVTQNGAPWVATPSNPTVKKGVWILQDPANTGGGCCGQDPNNFDWGGPNDLHLETANVGFADGHVKAMKFGSWFSGNSPWLNPAVGG